jgi:polysaccharide pyruvyl transferase WcaK-like protein
MIKVLCLGAFANGNLGDMYQADAVARLVREVRSDAEVFSVSPSKRNSTYPTNDQSAGPSGAAFEPAYINSFDILFVGGGGLLSAPHAPLNNADWVNAITIPICAISVGAVTDTANISREFIQKCALFSVRDEFSFDAVKEI